MMGGSVLMAQHSSKANSAVEANAELEQKGRLRSERDVVGFPASCSSLGSLEIEKNPERTENPRMGRCKGAHVMQVIIADICNIM